VKYVIKLNFEGKTSARAKKNTHSILLCECFFINVGRTGVEPVTSSAGRRTEPPELTSKGRSKKLVHDLFMSQRCDPRRISIVFLECMLIEKQTYADKIKETNIRLFA